MSRFLPSPVAAASQPAIPEKMRPTCGKRSGFVEAYG